MSQPCIVCGLDDDLHFFDGDDEDVSDHKPVRADQRIKELERQLSRFQSFVDSLPHCMGGWTTNGTTYVNTRCGKIATYTTSFGYMSCDEHANHKSQELSWAKAVRETERT